MVLSLWRRDRNRKESRRKRRLLVVRNPIILLDNARSHTAAVTDLLYRWKWDSGTSTVLTLMNACDYDLFAKVIKKTTARDPVQHKRLTYPCFKAANTEHQKRWTGWWCTTPSKHLAESDKAELLQWRYINVLPLWIKPARYIELLSLAFIQPLVKGCS